MNATELRDTIQRGAERLDAERRAISDAGGWPMDEWMRESARDYVTANIDWTGLGVGPAEALAGLYGLAHDEMLGLTPESMDRRLLETWKAFPPAETFTDHLADVTHDIIVDLVVERCAPVPAL